MIDSASFILGFLVGLICGAYITHILFHEDEKESIEFAEGMKRVGK